VKTHLSSLLIKNGVPIHGGSNLKERSLALEESRLLRHERLGELDAITTTLRLEAACLLTEESRPHDPGMLVVRESVGETDNVLTEATDSGSFRTLQIVDE
jgi:hypothetical protein